MTKKDRITIRMPKELNLLLSNMAKKLGISKNALVLKILWEEVNKV